MSERAYRFDISSNSMISRVFVTLWLGYLFGVRPEAIGPHGRR
jgi:hypothetical protein